MHTSQLGLPGFSLLLLKVCAAPGPFLSSKPLVIRQASAEIITTSVDDAFALAELTEQDNELLCKRSQQPQPEPFFDSPIATSSNGNLLFSRDFDQKNSFITVTSTGCAETTNQEPVYPIHVDPTNMTVLLQDAKIWAATQQAAGATGNETNQGYFKFCSHNLALTTIAYGAALEGTPKFGFQEYWNIADNLLKRVLAKSEGLTWEGTLQDAQHHPYVDIFMTPCFEDVDVDLNNMPPLGTNPDSQGPDNPAFGEDGTNAAIAKRTRTRGEPQKVPSLHDIWIVAYITTIRVPTGQMNALINVALDDLNADTGDPDKRYPQFTVGLEGIDIPEGSRLASRLLQYRPSAANRPVRKSVLLKILGPLGRMAQRERWDIIEGNTMAMHFEIRQGRNGPVVGRLSWGDTLYQYFENPTGKKPFWQRFNCFRAPDATASASQDGLY